MEEVDQVDQVAEDTKQVEELEQSSPEDLAVDPNVEQPSQDPTVIIVSDAGVDG